MALSFLRTSSVRNMSKIMFFLQSYRQVVKSWAFDIWWYLKLQPFQQFSPKASIFRPAPCIEPCSIGMRKVSFLSALPRLVAFWHPVDVTSSNCSELLKESVFVLMERCFLQFPAIGQSIQKYSTRITPIYSPSIPILSMTSILGTASLHPSSETGRVKEVPCREQCNSIASKMLSSEIC